MSDNKFSMDDLTAALNDLQIKIHEETPIPAEKNPDILSDMLKTLDHDACSLWRCRNFNDDVFQLTELECYNYEYLKIKTLFDSTMKKSYTVDKIERVENPYLLVQYNLKKLKKKCSERTLFHGTARACIKPICSKNFNWRLSGSSFGHKFGKGISFSPSSTYSSYYPRNSCVSQRIMIVASVLIKGTCHGSPSMEIPPEPADTSINNDGNVIVKYEDCDYYPKYVIYYS